ncbi:uncharacterized protein LTR77_003734 [Saxophila tyrrhenica]|uniref:Uncharacterized protein n=1 Tax=Saxophila tyrrhenica TaxID=1690608 RepID=A0AAV9PHV6_9PEZI|nr:hypothetical protein LTR77_003734 [Saxophila tyrrhenica]
MSNDAGNVINSADSSARNALDVGFASVSNGRHGESSSMAESRSSGKRSVGSSSRGQQQQQHQEDPVTPEERRQRADGEGSSRGSAGHHARRSGGFLLDSVFANGSPKGPQDTRGKRKAQDGQLRVDKRRQQAQSVRSAESSLRGSPLAREVSVDGSAEVDGMRNRQSSRPRPQSMDPAQLVQMALSLSESRKRNVSSSLQVPLPAANRVVSMPVSNYGTVRASSAARKRSSQMSDSRSRSNASGAGRGSDELPIVSSPGPDNVMYTFTPATLSRAEKARKYFELASEHRRLLQHLPPLKPDASAPGNFTFETKNQPGSNFPLIRRVTSSGEEKHALGREYNPIQALRNRRVRIREKRPFPAPPDSWANPEGVKRWVDDVETATDHPQYRATPDEAQIPRYEGDDETIHGRTQQGASGHRRTDTVGSVITRPENSWTIEPTELLADTYWTEKSDNKAYIENRFGNNIFPDIERRKSTDTPRISVEMHRGRDEHEAAGVESEDFEDSGKASRRRKLLLPLVSSGREHQRKNRKLLSRSPSESSMSSTDGRRRSREKFENIGPLERHMQDLIAKDEHGELSSPDMVSPDHWDHKPMQFPRMSTDDSYRDSPPGRSSGRDSLDVPRDLHRRSKSADGRVNSTDQNVFAVGDHRPSTSYPEKSASSSSLERTGTLDSRRSLDAPRPQGSNLPGFRSRSKDRNMVDQLDFAAATPTNLEPIMSGEGWRPKTSQDPERPIDLRRHKTGDSFSGSLHRLDTSATNSTFSSVKDPGSSVGRFLKGGRDRIGTLVRGERFRNKERPDTGVAESYRAASDMSDLEDGESGSAGRWRSTDSPNDSSDVSPRASLDRNRTSQKIQLPSFASTRGRRGVVPGAPITANTNPFERTKSSQSDSSKGQKLPPPRINIPEEDSTRDAAPPPTTIRFDTTPRKSYGDLGLDASMPSARTISRSPGQRHWSIYDQAQPLQPANRKITARDIAGVRALLLCSGIKAREIQRRGNQPRNPAPAELAQAAETANKGVPTVPIKDEHLEAARLLSDHLTTVFSSFESGLSHFQTTTARNLASRLDTLQQKASDQLTTHVHDASDEADAFIVELTTKQPQQTKRVDEAVDTMVRRRRRQFRLLRQAGFKVLEWAVLGVMWWIWFMVVVFKFAKRMVVGVGRGVRWLFVF